MTDDDELGEPDEVRLDGEGKPIVDEPFAERVVDQWPLALVLLGVAVGMAVLVLANIRVGSLILSASVVFAGALRAVLPSDTAGLLVVRSTAIDLAVYGILGIGLTVLSLVVVVPTG